MKPLARPALVRWAKDFSALGRAVWDETLDDGVFTDAVQVFQCSRSSRMG